MKISTRTLPEVVLAIAAGLLVTACGAGRGPLEFPSDPEICGVYDGGVVTVGDVDVAVLALPPRERTGDGLTSDDFLRTVVEDIVLERLLLDDPDLDRDEVERRLASYERDELRRLTVEAFLKEHLPEINQPTEADINEYFEQHLEQRHQPGRREVHNIFLRAGGSHRSDDLMETARTISRRFDRGESFAALAREFSDSESRHQGGLIGWLGRSQLAPPVADVVFTLEEARLSEPIETPTGIHIFLVTGIVEGRTLELDEVRPSIRERLARERREAAVAELASALPEFPNTFVAEGDDLVALLRQGDPAADVLRMGDFRLNVAQFREMLTRGISTGAAATENLSDQMLQSIARRERIFAAAAAEGLDRAPSVTQALERSLQTARLKVRRRMVAERRIDADPDRLEQWFEDNRKRYQSPLRLSVSRLIVPFDPLSAGRTMAALEAFSRSQDGTAHDIEGEAARLGGEVDEMGWVTLPELAVIRPVAAGLASKMEAGEFSPPYRTATTLELLMVRELQPPEEQPFEAVRSRVRDEYLAAHATELYGEWAHSTLKVCRFRINLDRLGSAGSSTSESTDDE